MERKYALTKVKPGDYLLPSNDGRTLWRILQYEDGPSTGITDWPADRKLWGCWRWERTINPGDAHASDDALAAAIDDWDTWEMFNGMHDTRRSAIDSALKSD